MMTMIIKRQILLTQGCGSRQAGLSATAGPHTSRLRRGRRLRLSTSSWWSRKLSMPGVRLLTEASGTLPVNYEAAHAVIYYAHLSGTGDGFLSGVPRGGCLGVEISGPKGRLCGCAKLSSS